MRPWFWTYYDEQSLDFKVKLITRQSYAAYLATIVNSILYVIVTWQEAFRPTSIIWAVCVNLLTVIRLFAIRRIRQCEGKEPLSRLRRYFACFLIGAFVSGLLWGLIGWLYFDCKLPASQSISIFFLAGMTAGAVGAYSSILPILHAFLIPSLLPFILRSFMSAGPNHVAMGTAGLLYLILMIKIALNSHNMTIETIRLHSQISGLEAERKAASKLLANLSHEIRTPIAAIKGYVDLLQSAARSGSVETEPLAVIKRSSEHLVAIIDELLDFSKLRRGQSQLNYTWFSPTDEIKSVVQLTQPQNKRNIAIELKISSSVPDLIYSDAKVFRQILINLVNNALKFTPSGSIKISATLETRERRKQLVLDVTDSGIGIEPSLIPNLFRPFFRGANAYVRNINGSGLGLALSKDLAHLLGGDLELTETKLNGGSTFTLHFDAGLDRPLAIPKKSSAEPTARKDLSVLLVDDSPDLLALTARVLEKSGIQVTSCHCGTEAIALVNQSKFDLILMDLNMPAPDGYESTKIIRRSGFSNPIIALTGCSSAADRRRCRDIGFNDLLVKPVERNELLNTIARWSQVGRPDGANL